MIHADRDLNHPAVQIYHDNMVQFRELI